ncbi:MAG: winged helix-turn-helix domain-containing protein [Nanoarchaeota archaeon]|nr:winged helix-turn-helix domain-containing protein [Nanoarchaeota archaeon]MBU4352199.1 winged helix-turn-helix domain-containing protein [Nanoarchaeota archaeon]MBU4456431.1 winged helix-turn-helix domain-containing protein [Nanoarchaeota archaeon]MCG2719597.1 winged helix-turn-helix domain-containing protein [Nanoarchaeota archaeon]
MTFKELTLKKEKLTKKELNQELQWFSESLGLTSLRDKSKSCFRIFIELLKTTKMQKPASSDELAFKLNLTRGTVVHHLNKLMDSGLVVSQKNKYLLRTTSLKKLTEELKKDTEEFFEFILPIAEEIDKALS